MDALDRARIAKWSGDSLAQNRCLHEAFELESKAADLLYDKLDAEPTRGVLYRSAGWIALDLGLTREAEILACKGLSGNPPKSVQEELRQLNEQATWTAHLDRCGLAVPENSIVMSLSGNGIGYGVAAVNEVLPRMTGMKSLAERTGDRLSGRNYEPALRNRPPQHQVWLAAAAAASYAITLVVGDPGPRQLDLDLCPDEVPFPEYHTTAETSGQAIISEILLCLEAWQKQDISRLRELIQDDAYLRNFTNLACQISPDGERVKAVHFRTRGSQEGSTRDFHLVQRIEPAAFEGKGGLSAPDLLPVTLTNQPAIMTGYLREASMVSSKESLKIVPEDEGSPVRVIFKEGLEDLVRDAFGRLVRVQGRWKKRGRGHYIDAYSITGVVK